MSSPQVMFGVPGPAQGQLVSLAPNAGLQSWSTVCSAGTIANIVAVGNRTLYEYNFTNSGTAGWAYVKLYNGTGIPVYGAGTPQRTYGLPPGGGANLVIVQGLPLFQQGMGITVTTEAAGTSVGTLSAAGEVIINLGFA